MRFAIPLLFVAVLTVPARGDDPPKTDLKKGATFTGHSEARVVQIRPRVSGFLTRIAVKDGATVKKGDVLAEVDSRAYEAELKSAKAKLAVAEAEAKLAATDLARIKDAFAKGIVAKEELQKAEGAIKVAEAIVEASKATVQLAELNLSYTRLFAPMDGRVGTFATIEGNVVKADETLIVNVVAPDPIAVVFDVDERTFLAVARALEDKGKAVVEVGLGDEDGYPHKGTLGALPVTIDRASGKAQFRATLDNPKGLIVNGQFLRVRLKVEPK